MQQVPGFGMIWKWGSSTIKSTNYVCGYCGNQVTSEKGMPFEDIQKGGFGVNVEPYGVFICPNCHMPTFICEDVQVPGNDFGSEIIDAPDKVTEVYDEARKAYSVQSYTGVILLSRILLSHVAVDLGGPENANFVASVNYLKDNNFIPATSESWIDSIRKLGNRTNHDLIINTKEEAETMIKFCEMFLKINYEYPRLAQNILEPKEK